MCIIRETNSQHPDDGVVPPTTLRFKGESLYSKYIKPCEVDVNSPLGTPDYIVNYLNQIPYPHKVPIGLFANCQNGVWSYRKRPYAKLRYYEWLSTVESKTSEPKYWGFDFDNTSPNTCLGQLIFARIYNASFYSGITACSNQHCQGRKQAFEAAAPECDWPGFRDFILTCLACMIPVDGWDFVHDIILPKKRIEDYPAYINEELLKRKVPKSFCIDIRGIFDICRWSAWIAQGFSIISGLGIAPSEDRQSTDIAQETWKAILPEYELESQTISKTCHEKGLCPNRVWNVSFNGSNTSVGACLIVKASREVPPALKSKRKHEFCSAQHCLRAHDNSTEVQQAHKCGDGNCNLGDVVFQVDALNQASRYSNERGWFNTAWSLQPHDQAQRVMGLGEGKFMAISHVWSDGTGVGLKPHGRVNRCLYEYFDKIATKLGCEGLWWDTISIPSERAPRATAIEHMLENFERAEVTLVHDEELVNFPWSDDGSPAIAMVLSSWFTRGWTAAELFASRNHDVKVLFSDPKNPTGDPLIKDLDRDIFNSSFVGRAALGKWMNYAVSDISGTVPMQGYIVAVEAMERIRDTDRRNRGTIKSLSDLVNILSHRTTSWARDHMLIAGLMCGNLGIKPNTSGPEITKLILTHIAEIDAADLFHTQVPTATYGSWSWCPQSIYDFGQLYHSSSFAGVNFRVFPDGRLTGRFQAYEVLEDDEIHPCGSHPAIRTRISAALFGRRNCLLLSTPINQQDQLYILAEPVYMNGVTISCRWVACVRLQSPLSPVTEIGGRRRQLWLSKDMYFRFGNDVNQSGAPLPPMNFEDISLVTKSFGSDSEQYRGNRIISEGSRRRKKKYRSWYPQLIYFYDYDTQQDQHFENTDPSFTPSCPSTLLAWDLDKKESRIKESFVETLKNLVHIGKEGDDIVILSWSFPRKAIRCDFPQGQVSTFKTKFHIVSDILIKDNAHDISLGHDTFDEYVQPLIRTRGQETSIRSWTPCEDNNHCKQLGSTHGWDMNLFFPDGEAPRFRELSVSVYL